MPFNSQGYGNLFGGAVGEGGLGDLDTDYVRNTAVPITIGGITAGTYTPKGSIADVLDKLLYPYQNPIVSLASDIKTTVRQQGVDTIDSMILTATLTKKTGALWKVEFYKGDELLDTQEYVDGTNVYTYEYTTAITESTTFTAKVYDRNSKTGTSSLTYNFYYPNFDAVSVSEFTDITMDEIVENGNMRLEAKANKSLIFTGTMARYIFSYPQSFGTITSVLDDKGFEYLPSFKRVSMTYNSGTDSVPMYTYILQEPCTLTNYKMTFKF